MPRWKQTVPWDQLDRTAGLGGSDIAAVAGLSRWAGPLDVYERKLSGQEKATNELMRRGKVLEHVLAARFADRHQVQLLETDTILDPDVPFFYASPDRLHLPRRAERDVRRGWEGKTAGFYMAPGWGPEEENGPIPDDAFAQSQWYMGITGATEWDVTVGLCTGAVVVDGTDLVSGEGLEERDYVVDRDDQVIEGLRELGGRFWKDHVLPRRPPEPGSMAKDEEALRRLFPTEQRPMIEADQHLEDLVYGLRNWEAAAAHVKEGLQLAKNRVIHALGDLEGCTGTFGQITYRVSHPKPKTDWQAVVTDLRVDLGLLRENTQGKVRQQLDALAERLDVIQAAQTSTPDGVRSLRKPRGWAKDGDATVALAGLGAGGEEE